MIPPEFANFFGASAQAAAALVGLLFVSVSLAPEQTVARSAPVERQAVSASTFTALLNALFISLAPLLPHGNFPVTVLAVGGFSVVSTLALGWTLFQAWTGWANLVRSALLFGGALVLYGIEMKEGFVPMAGGASTGPLATLTQLLLFVYALAVLRAWQLLGGQGLGPHSWLSLLRSSEERLRGAGHETRSAAPRGGAG